MKAQELYEIAKQQEISDSNRIWEDNKDKLFDYFKQCAECRQFGTIIRSNDDIAEFKNGANWISVRYIRDKFFLELEKLGYKVTCNGEYVNVIWDK